MATIERTGSTGFPDLVVYRRIDDPFAEGAPLYGFERLDPALKNGQRCRYMANALYLSRKQRARLELGVLPDGRWALVGTTGRYPRCAVERVGPTVSPSYRLRHISAIAPLPEHHARELLRRMWRGASWEDVLAGLGTLEKLSEPG